MSDYRLLTRRARPAQCHSQQVLLQVVIRALSRSQLVNLRAEVQVRLASQWAIVAARQQALSILQLANRVRSEARAAQSLSLPVLALMAAALALLVALAHDAAATLPCVLAMVPWRVVACVLLPAMHPQVHVVRLALLISLQVPAAPKPVAASHSAVAQARHRPAVMSRWRLLTAIQVAPYRCRQVYRRRVVVQLAF